MSTMIQIRNVPNDLHTTLKVRAVEAGLSLSEYVLRELADIASRPTVDEILARLRALPVVSLPADPAVEVRSIRDARS